MTTWEKEECMQGLVPFGNEVFDEVFYIVSFDDKQLEN